MIILLFFFLIQPPSTATVSGRVELGQARIQSSANRPQSRYSRGGRGADAAKSAVPVVVWIEGTGTQARPASSTPVLNQKDTQFEPRMVVVVAGQRVRILNSDPIYHNVFSLSDVKRFNVGRRPAGEHVDVLFEKPGEVSVFCDIHSSMNATIRVLPTTTVQWVVLDGAGEFRLPNLAPGRYSIHVAAPGYAEVRQAVVLSAGQRLELDAFVLEP
jgi:plastocyanin